MLNNVAIAVNSIIRNRVINDPNKFFVKVMRKTVTRVSDSESMGLPTLGGIGVISSEDESEFEFFYLGSGYALPCNGSFTPSLMMERGDANNGQDETYFLIEPEILDAFEIQKGDVFYISEVNNIPVSKYVAYEVVKNPETVGNIPPYNKRYICNRRDDLHLV